ncbi:MAG: hypothetical protein ISS54_06635 [Dehalococcoidia bacterium]|nr:hypothetical protein [Dehalococcoidia bacterium]
MRKKIFSVFDCLGAGDFASFGCLCSPSPCPCPSPCPSSSTSTANASI